MTDHDDELRAMLALAAVDALDEGEERALQQALAERPDLAAELDDLRAAAATMASAVAEAPPPTVRTGVLDAIAAESAAVNPAPAAPSGPTAGVSSFVSRHRRWLVLAAAAVVVLASAAVATRVLDDSSADDIAAVLDDREAVSVELSGEMGDLEVVYSADERRAVMRGDGIAGLADDEVYELWTLPPGTDAMVSVGTFRPDGDGVVEVLMDAELVAAARFAITVEPEGGSEAPTSPPVAESR